MDDKKITLELTGNQYRNLVKLVFLGGTVAEEVFTDETMAEVAELQQKIYASSGLKKGNMFIEYDKTEDDYFLADDLEDELVELLDEYDEGRFWENLVMRLTMRDLKKKFTDKQIQEMPEEKGTMELEVIHDYYINEFDDHDVDNLKIVSMKKV